jgi:hypothetical protein
MIVEILSPKTALIKCDCESEMQDELYGDHKRLHNRIKKNKWRCTVCKKEKGK